MRFLAIPIVLVAAATACSSHSGGGGGDDDPSNYSSVVIEPATATVTLMLGGMASQAYQVFGLKGSDKTDITANCQLTLDSDAGSFTGATATVTRGGHIPVDAVCGSVQATTAYLDANLTGTIVDPSAPPNSGDLFGGATAGTDPTRIPAIEYPIDQAVSPRNIPAIEVQWTAGGNDLFHVSLVSSHGTIDAYTANVQQALDPQSWAAVANTAAGETLKFTVEGLQKAAPATKFTSAPVGITMSVDNVDQTAIYYWASSVGNIMEQTFGDTAAPTAVKGGCTSCHTVSRTGSRIGYSRCTAGGCQYMGFLKYNQATDKWDEIVNADAQTLAGSYTTFAPPGNPFATDDKAVVIGTMNNGKLRLLDPDTGTDVASNIDVSSHDAAGNPTRPALMADWSPDGNTVVFVQADNTNGVDVGGGKLFTMSYKFQNNMHIFGEPQKLVTDPITLPNGTYNNFFFPSWSPDMSVISFDAARSNWRNTSAGNGASPGQRMMLADAGGKWVKDLTALNGGYVDANITWSHWAPASSADYYWLVFSSERNYGHEITRNHTNAGCVQNGTLQCKQIWVAAVSKDKIGQLLANPNADLDPSFAPMWLPGQDTQTDNISPYWSIPPGIE